MHIFSRVQAEGSDTIWGQHLSKLQQKGKRRSNMLVLKVQVWKSYNITFIHISLNNINHIAESLEGGEWYALPLSDHGKKY